MECGKNDLTDRSVFDDRCRAKGKATLKNTASPCFHTASTDSGSSVWTLQITGLADSGRREVPNCGRSSGE
jgi:hypothetical protein